MIAPIARASKELATRRPTPPERRRLVIVVILLILFASAGLRLYHLSFPREYMFDEVYYAKDAKAIVDGRVGTDGKYRWAAGDAVSWPHPEAGKFAIAAGILLFGDRSIGWRLPSVLAGLVILACVYPIARRLGLAPSWAVVALLFAAADPLGIVQSRIATLDVFVAVWTVLCVWLALRAAQADERRGLWLLLCGVAGALALSTKWSGLLALVTAAFILLAAWWGRRVAAHEEAARATTRTAEADGAPASGAAEGETGNDVAGARDEVMRMAAHGEVEPARDSEEAMASATAADPLPALAATTGASLTAPTGAAATATATQEPASTASPATPLGTALPVAARSPGLTISGVLVVLAAFLLIPAVIYMACYAQYFLKGHSMADWWELHRQMWHFGVHLHAEHSYASKPPTWIVDFRPVWYFFEGGAEYRGVVAIGNPFLWWLATLSLIAAPVLAFWRRRLELLAPAAIVAALYLPWFAASRTSFLYYMTPVAPFLAVLAAAALAFFARGREIHARGWVVVAATALATALLWRPAGYLAEWLFWTLPRQVSPVLGWVAVGLGVLLVTAAILALVSPRLRRRRPLIAAVAAGLVVGIVVCFIPVALAIPISQEHFSRITWFPSWI